MYGKTYSLSAETKAKISEALTGENHPRGMLGKTHSEKTKAKISASKGSAIYVYDTQGSLVSTISSANKAAKFFKCNHNTIITYAKNGKLFKKEWILSTKEHPTS